jgi:hypothetical protein
MKNLPWLLFELLAGFTARGQGNLVYDQQSQPQQAGGQEYPFSLAQPAGQSFIPALTSVGFVQFEFVQFYAGQYNATVYVNLLANSITGPVLGSTAVVSVPENDYNFIEETLYFPSAVAVTPGTTYYLQPVQQSDMGLGIIGGLYNYPSGVMYEYGTPNSSGVDAWFCEGVVVPEPSPEPLALLAAAGFCVFSRLRTNTNQTTRRLSSGVATEDLS